MRKNNDRNQCVQTGDRSLSGKRIPQREGGSDIKRKERPKSRGEQEDLLIAFARQRHTREACLAFALTPERVYGHCRLPR